MSRLRSAGPARAVLLAIVAVLVLALSIGATLVARADTATTFYACLKSNGDLGNVTQSPAAQPTCTKNETLISWNQSGPAGPAGPQGPAGNGAGPATPHKAIIGTVTFGEMTSGVGQPPISGSFNLYGLATGLENTATIGSTSGGAGAGKAKFSDLTLVMNADKAGVPLYYIAASGGHFATVTVDIFAPGTDKVVMTYKYSMVLVTKVSDSDSGAVGDALVREVTLAVGATRWTYTDPQTGQTTEQAWNQITNRSGDTIP